MDFQEQNKCLESFFKKHLQKNKSIVRQKKKTKNQRYLVSREAFDLINIILTDLKRIFLKKCYQSILIRCEHSETMFNIVCKISIFRTWTMSPRNNFFRFLHTNFQVNFRSLLVLVALFDLEINSDLNERSSVGGSDFFLPQLHFLLCKIIINSNNLRYRKREMDRFHCVMVKQ